MKKNFFPFLAVAFSVFCLQPATAQNTSPYWSLAGNSNAAASSKLGTTNGIPLRLFTNNAERIRITPTGQVGIGITTPVSIVTIRSSGSGTPVSSWLNAISSPIITGFSDGINGELNINTASSAAAARRAVFQGKRSRGTLTAPTAVINNDYLLSFVSSGYDGSAFQNPATIDFYVDGTPSAGNVPGRISFVTGTNTGNRQERLVIKSNGNVGIGTTSPSEKLYVSGNARFNGSVGIRGAINTSYALTVNASSSFSGIEVTDPVDGSVLSCVKSGILSGIRIEKTIANSGSACITGNSTGTSPGLGGFSTNGEGVKAISTNNSGVYGESTSGYGVYALSNSGGGVLGQSTGSYGGTFSSINGYGLYAGTTNGFYAAYFSGAVYSTGGYYPSDRNLKKNIKEFTNGMDIINKLKPKHYDYKNDGKYAMMKLPEGNHYGLIAQELEGVLPNLVKETTQEIMVAKQPVIKKYFEGNELISTVEPQTGEKETITIMAVNYTELIPIVIKALQEQDAQITELKKKADRVDVLEARLQKLEALLTKSSSNGSINVISASLEQSTPNPARGTATIRYGIPEGALSARLTISNAKGQVLKEVRLASNGAGQVNLNTASFPAGVYHYTLWVEGKKAATRQMVIAR